VNQVHESTPPVRKQRRARRAEVGRVAIVTGGGSGIGRALSQELAERGAVVFVADVDPTGAERTASDIRVRGGVAWPSHVDVAEADEVNGLVRAVARDRGRLDYMFNNAGTAICGEIRDLKFSDWDRSLRVNLYGTIHGTMAAYRVMLEQGFGHIVNTASLGGLVPEPFAAPYVAGKIGVVGLTLALRAEAEAFGIRASVFCPGFVRTRILETAAYVGVSREDAIREIGALEGRSPQAAVRSLLRGVSRNRAVIADGLLTWVIWRAYRTSPKAVAPLLRKGVRDLRATRCHDRGN